jgi:cytosine/uracil/thiamine/allantoin permease
MCYFLYWLIQFPVMLLSPQKLRHFFTFKSIIVPAAWVAMLIWALVKVPARDSLGPRHSQIGGSAMSWAWLSALNSALGFYATLSVNIPDFTVSIPPVSRNMSSSQIQRYAKNEQAFVHLVLSLAATAHASTANSFN